MQFIYEGLQHFEETCRRITQPRNVKKIKKKICHECIQLIIVILLFIIIKYTQIDKDKINLNSDKYTALFAAERNVN